MVRLTLKSVLKTPVDRPGVSLTMKLSSCESLISWLSWLTPTELRMDKTTYMKK